MGSFGEYTIAKSSSADINNIRWTKKNQDSSEKPKKNKGEKKVKTASTSSSKIQHSFSRRGR